MPTKRSCGPRPRSRYWGEQLIKYNGDDLPQNALLGVAPGSVLNALVSIYRALGGGWQLREGNGYVDPDTLNEMRERTNWGELLDN